MELKTSQLANELIKWLSQKVKDAGAKGGVLGISGGIDSAVVAGLASKAFPLMGLILPCHSQKEDIEHGYLVAEAFGFPVKEISLDDIYDQFIRILDAEGIDPRDMAVANIKPRLRMTTLYFYAAKYNYLVLGTGNKSELTVGYFTKHGDSGVDLLPLGSLVKSQVVELAKYLGVPKEIINKPPTAGLWKGQTDEMEMGITYEELDRFILEGTADPKVAKRINELNKRSQHKRNLPPIFNVNF